MSRKRTFVALLCGGFGLVALGVLFVALGLEKADQVSSVIGGLSGLAGLTLAVLSLRSAGRQDRHGRPDEQGRPVRQDSEDQDGDQADGVVVDMRIGRQQGEATGVEARGPVSGGAQVTMDIDETGPGSRTTGYREV